MSALRSRVVFDTSIQCADRRDDGLRAGEELAAALAEALRAAGIEVVEDDGTAWSWWLRVQLGEIELDLDVADQAEWAPAGWPRWAILLEEPDSASLLAIIRGKRATPARVEAFQRLQQTIHTILRSDSRFSGARWFRASEWNPDSTAQGAPEP